MNQNPALDYLSASRLKSFLSCRLKFYYEKVLKLPAPSSPNLQIGKAVHAGLEALHKAQWEGQPHDTDTVLKAYEDAYTSLEAEDPVDYGNKDRESCLETGKRTLRAFLESDLVNDPRPIRGVEVTLRREDDELPIPLLGVVDLVRENTAIDFKTVGATPDLKEEAWSHELQMICYFLLLADATGELPAPAELVYLVKTKTPKVIRHQLPTIDLIQMERFRRLVDVYVDANQRQEYYPSPGMHCRWCEFRSRCRAWGQKSNAA
ncbi:PD-(D/E)XK nuclease family protein [Kiritimatiellaeota bacterium B1221]|nr:PD-(D/E)XK nuclease family protein [Kiritimatiellaeota bacterium B1221]